MSKYVILIMVLIAISILAQVDEIEPAEAATAEAIPPDSETVTEATHPEPTHLLRPEEPSDANLQIGESGNTVQVLSHLSGYGDIFCNSWFRGGTADNGYVRLYGNSRQMVFRTDGTTQYSDHGPYPFVWNYGSDGSAYRRMILNSDGTLWTSAYGWLHDRYAQTSKVSGYVYAGNWYRIAYNSGNRANAEFTLRDFISGGGHSTLTFRVGTSFNYRDGISFTVLNHNFYSTPTFSYVRLLTAGTYDTQYLEVYCSREGSVDFSIYDNLQSSGWVPVAWTAGGIPGGYTSTQYDVNSLFMAANIGDGESFRVYRDGRVSSPLYYDADNTGYYMDPNSWSRLSSFGVDNQYTYGENYYYSWIRKLGSGSSGLYWQEGTGAYWHIYPRSQQDMYFRTGSGNGGIVGTIADETPRGYIHWTTSNEIGFLDNTRSWQLRSWDGGTEIYDQTRSPIYYDSNDLSYFSDPNGWSVFYGIGSYYLRNNYDVSVDHPYGIYFANGLSTAYAIYRESGGWSHPYPDLRIAFHTGIKLGANASYNGIRFYSDYDMSTLVMAVNDASTSGANNVRVAYNLSVGCNHTYDVVMDNAGGEPTVRPSYGNWGYCGTSSYYWYRFYSNYKSAIKPNPFIAGSEIAREDGGIDKSVRNYCTESIKYTVEDWGVGQLVNGEARVEFYEYTKIWLSPFIKPIVTITPMGDCKGLYIADITPEGFTVKELMSGASNVKFNWRLAGIRAGDEVISSVVDEELDKIMSDNKMLRTQNPEKPENRQSLIEYSRIMFREAKKRGFVTALEQLELTTEGEALLKSMR